MEQIGEDALSCEVELLRALVFSRLGKYDSVKEVLSKIDRSDESAVFHLEAQIYFALVYACEGRYDEALSQLPCYEELKQYGNLHAFWIEVICLCAPDNSAIKDQSSLGTCMHMLLYAEERGLLQYSENGCDSSAAFNAASDNDSAHDALDVMKHVQSKLHTDLRASELIENVFIRIFAS